MGSAPLMIRSPLNEQQNPAYSGVGLPPLPALPGMPGAAPALDPLSQSRLNAAAKQGNKAAIAAGGVGGPGGATGAATAPAAGASNIAKAASGASGAPGASPGPVTGPNITNTSGPDPYLTEQINNYRARLGSDVTQEATDKATSNIRDAASGMAEQEKADLARRGISDSGAGERYIQSNIYQPAQRNIAKAASDIQLGRQAQLDALVLGGSGLMAEPGKSSLANRQLGLQEWTAGNQNNVALGQLGVSQQALANQNAQQQAAAQQAAQQAQIQEYIQMMNLQMSMANGGYTNA